MSPPPPYLLTSRRFDKRFVSYRRSDGLRRTLMRDPHEPRHLLPVAEEEKRRYGFDVYSGEDGVFECVYVDADEGDIRKGVPRHIHVFRVKPHARGAPSRGYLTTRRGHCANAASNAAVSGSALGEEQVIPIDLRRRRARTAFADRQSLGHRFQRAARRCLRVSWSTGARSFGLRSRTTAPRAPLPPRRGPHSPWRWLCPPFHDKRAPPGKRGNNQQSRLRWLPPRTEAPTGTASLSLEPRDVSASVATVPAHALGRVAVATRKHVSDRASYARRAHRAGPSDEPRALRPLQRMCQGTSTAQGRGLACLRTTSLRPPAASCCPGSPFRRRPSHPAADSPRCLARRRRKHRRDALACVLGRHHGDRL